MKHHLTTDGTHTSELGARQIGSFVAQQISALQRP
jgi:lysophospholipase L1-like esterase